MGRSPCFDKLRMKQDVLANNDYDSTKRFAYMPKHGSQNWTNKSKNEVSELVGRYGKSCKLMRKTSDCLKQSFTAQEEDLIIKLHATIGSRWFIIAQQLPGRTDNEVKTIWNTKLRKKLTAMGIDPVTHRPFSQILADYGNIGACTNANKSRFGSLNRSMKANADLCTSVITSDSGCSSNYETSRNSMISNNNNSNDHNLLSQLEAIKLVTEAESSYSNNTDYMPNHFNSEVYSHPQEPASSESPSSSSTQGGPSLGFNWADFLLEDELPSGTILEQVNHGNSSRDVFLKVEPNDDCDFCNVQMDNFEATLPSSRSFVESILENEHDMLSDFQGLAEDQFYY